MSNLWRIMSLANKNLDQTFKSLLMAFHIQLLILTFMWTFCNLQNIQMMPPIKSETKFMYVKVKKKTKIETQLFNWKKSKKMLKSNFNSKIITRNFKTSMHLHYVERMLERISSENLLFWSAGINIFKRNTYELKRMYKWEKHIES